MSVVDFVPLTQEQYWELEYQMDRTPSPYETYTIEGRHPELAELLRKFGYPPAGRYEAYDWGVKFLEMGVRDEQGKATDSRRVDGTGQSNEQGRCDQPRRGIQFDGVPLRLNSIDGSIRAQGSGSVQHMGCSNETMGNGAEEIDMDVPEFLKIGNTVWAGFAGWIEDIAVGEGTIMVKIESPKRKLHNRGEEWLPYRSGIMRPLTVEDYQFDLDIHDKRMSELIAGYESTKRTLAEKMAA